jgi:hypothetical protein
MHSFGADNLLILQKYFAQMALERGFYGFFIVLMLISISNSAVSQSQTPDSLQLVQNNNVANPDSIIDVAEIAIDNEVFYFGKDSTVMDLEAEKIYLYGMDSYVKYGDLEVKAARIEFSFQDFTAFAKGIPDSTGKLIGRPIFKEGENQFEEDSLSYNFKSKKGMSYGATTQQGDMILIAGVSKKQANNWIDIGNGKLTTCDNPNPHYYFHLKKAIAIPDEKVVSGPLYMKVRKVPTPLALPFGFFPNKKESSHGILLPGYGNGNERGYFLQNLGYYIPISKHWETSFLFDVYTRGSWVARNKTNYKKIYKYSGGFNVSRTVSKTGIPELNTDAKLKTFNVQWNHAQDAKARPNSRFNANVNVGSSKNFTNNLNSSQQDYLSSTFQSSVQWNKTFPGTPFALGVSANHSQNTQTRIVNVTLPAVALTMSRVNIFKKVFVKNPIGFNASGSLENSISTHESNYQFSNLNYLSGIAKNGASYNGSLSTSLKLPKGISFNPSVNGTWLWTFKYLQKSLDETTQTVSSDTLYGFRQNLNWNTGGSFNWRWYGTYTRKNPDRNVKAIRHVIQPNVGVTYTPFKTVERYGYYGDDGSFLGYSEWDLSRYIPSETKEAFRVNIGVTQNVEAKVRDKSSSKVAFKKIKLIESFRLNTAYNVIADSLNWSNLSVNGFTTIAKNTTFTYSGTFSFYEVNEKGREINQFVWNNGGLLRNEGSTFTLTTRLSGGSKDGTNKSKDMTSAEEDYVQRNSNNLIDLSIPWTLDLNYNVQVSKQWNDELIDFESTIIQSATFRGSVNVMQKASINFDSGYDFEAKELTPTTIGMTFDLHCWELTGTWVPFGTRKSYMVQLNIKSQMLKDLKLQKRGNYGDLLY